MITTNPVVKTTTLRSFDGWAIREYADGVFDGAHLDGARTTGEASFGDALNVIRAMDDDAMDAPSDWDAGSVTFDPYVG